MNTTQDIKKVPVHTGVHGRNLYTEAHFFFKQDGVKYSIDYIDHDYVSMRIRNSKTGSSKLVLIDSEITNGRYRDSYFFQFI